MDQLRRWVSATFVGVAASDAGGRASMLRRPCVGIVLPA